MTENNYNPIESQGTFDQYNTGEKLELVFTAQRGKDTLDFQSCIHLGNLELSVEEYFDFRNSDKLVLYVKPIFIKKMSRTINGNPYEEIKNIISTLGFDAFVHAISTDLTDIVPYEHKEESIEETEEIIVEEEVVEEITIEEEQKTEKGSVNMTQYEENTMTPEEQVAALNKRRKLKSFSINNKTVKEEKVETVEEINVEVEEVEETDLSSKRNALNNKLRSSVSKKKEQLENKVENVLPELEYTDDSMFDEELDVEGFFAEQSNSSSWYESYNGGVSEQEIDQWFNEKVIHDLKISFAIRKDINYKENVVNKNGFVVEVMFSDNIIRKFRFVNQIGTNEEGEQKPFMSSRNIKNTSVKEKYTRIEYGEFIKTQDGFSFRPFYKQGVSPEVLQAVMLIAKRFWGKVFNK